MKKVILLFMLLPYAAAGQVFDNFENGLSDSWVQSIPGRWSADSAGALSGKFSLHHSFDNTESGTDRIGLMISDLHAGEGTTEWTFLIRHGYEPSSSNNWVVYLMSDLSPSLISSDTGARGFAIGVNLTGYDDTLRLWKIRDNEISVVVNSHVNWQKDIGINEPVRIRVERDKDGLWSVNVSGTDDSIIKESSGYEAELFESLWFGVSYKYSSTRDRLLWIDDISVTGVFYRDILPPAVTGYKIWSRNSLEIMLNEEATDSFTDLQNFHINPGENIPVSVLKRGPLSYVIRFPREFINKHLNTLVVSSLCDKENNCRTDTGIIFTPVWAETGDIVITEIMADPVPPVSLPAKEYFELKNRSDFSLDLTGWTLYGGEQTYLFPSFSMAPEEIRIIASIQDTGYFKEYGKVTGLRQFPSLTDQGKLLCLTDTSGSLIHGVEYSDKWYGRDLKSQGGWSLEIIDDSFPFYYEGNWKASVSRKGGTPGAFNSVMAENSDRFFHGINNLVPDNSTMLTIRFSEPVTGFVNMAGAHIKDGPDIEEILVPDKLFREFKLLLSSPIKNKTVYEFHLADGVYDFAGNKALNSTIFFGLPESVSQGDISFNELLFNPFPGEPDYIELYNCTEKIIDASKLYLASVNELNSDTSALLPVSPEKRCLLPHTYYVVTTDREKVTERYFSSAPDAIFEIPALPSMPDDKGYLLLLNNELDIIDKVSYNERMHYSLLSGVEGISLEKTGTCNPSAEPASWHSATESSGWGTPGNPNSVRTETIHESSGISLSSTKITPDNDSYEDFLTISLKPGGNENIISVTVFDEYGSFIRKIASNMLSGSELSLIWDATAEDGSPVRSGIYIIYITWYNDTGISNRSKRVCTVLR